MPDDTQTIQAAIDSFADTVLVRPGHYAETPTVRRPILLAAASPSSLDRPSLDGLSIHPLVTSSQHPYAFRHLAMLDTVTVLNDNAIITMEFTSCHLGGGIEDLSFFDRTSRITVEHCEVYGLLELWARDSCLVDSCQLYGGIQSVSSPVFLVTNSTFQGDGTAYAIDAIRTSSFEIDGNEIRGYGIGVSVRAESFAGRVTDNVIEDCHAYGITARAPEGLVASGNVLRRCGVGLYVEQDNYVATGNRIESCDWGIWAGAGAGAIVESNLVYGCRFDGIQVDHVGGAVARIANNTTCLNGGSGMTVRLDLLGEGSQIDVVRNVGWGNGGWGIYWRAQPEGRVTRVACNNWFGNGTGEVGGALPSQEDISVDPQFCDATSGDFRLLAASALADWPGCGLIGAMGAGCGLTGTVVVRFVAERTDGGVRIIWELGEGSTAEEVWVERSDEVSGPWWRPVMERSRQGRTVIEHDVTALAERSYSYRLMAREEGVTAVVSAPVPVKAGVGLRFAILQVGPNPASGPVRIEFEVERMAPIEIDVFDVQGRNVASVARGEWPAGRHVLVWHGLAGRIGAAPAGWYLLRYRYPGGQETKQLLRAR